MIIQTAFGVAAALATWQLVVLALRPPRYMLPEPWTVAQTLWRRRDLLMREGATTATEALLGLLVGAVAGALAGLATAAWPRAGAIAWPVLIVLQSLPVFALAPLLVLWFGFGMASKVAMSAIVIFFPVASFLADGLRRTDPDLLDATALTEASHWRAIQHVRLPLAMPAFVSGLRVAAPLAPLGAVIGEWVGASGGLGFLMIQANARLQTDLMFACLALLAALTLFLRAVVDALAPRFVPWAPEASLLPSRA
ncbi:ABC transporter permease [Aureimonas jatrophae]|uniref:Putative hydroxymethylpyrimidine transport system permease protein n=1 Tax=Aureimonas jatrophae TaxID=1166073 RepID=A0A1H0KT29_9HYPH|nr:ABC transporter permease subunit [Aureimonas jatrophae]MBB3948862.1 putative hydroxymethylpyrimidine transport system permease protein [Aureimonas jatrophae]SDO59117.1 putative hydroxymethylpyrimidine transport system permease protein [Aureimonas jatrophae]